MADLKTQAAELESKIASAKGELNTLQQQLTDMRERMKEKLLAEWPSPWQNEQIVATKVQGRLAENKDFKELIKRIRETEARIDSMEAQLRAQSGSAEDEVNPKSQGYMPSATSAEPQGYMPGGKQT